MFIKRILKIGLVAIVASALTTVQAQVPQPAPKPDKPTKEKPERGGKKWDHEKVKGRLKAAFEKRNKHRGDAKKRGNKVRDRKKGDRKDSGFGKLVRDDAKIKELQEAFAAASKKGHKGFDRTGWKDATDDEKKALREKMSAGRKEWYEKMKTHREEVGKRIKEIRAEFKNNRDKVIDGNDPGAWKGKNIVIQYHKPYYIPSSIADRKTKSIPEVNWELQIPRSKVGRVIIRRPASRGGDIVIE